MKNSEAFPETCDRFVAYFDIMGFKDLIYRNSHDEVKKRMTQLSKIFSIFKSYEKSILKSTLQQNNFKQAQINIVFFSDSILFISGSNTNNDALKLLGRSSLFIVNALKINIPIKGALSYGTFTADLNNSIYFGRPLIDSYMITEDSFYYGATIHHSFEKYITNEKYKSCFKLIKRGPVPFKTGSVNHYYVDVSFVYNTLEMKDEFIKSLKKLYHEVSGKTRKYVDNTLDLYFNKSTETTE